MTDEERGAYDRATVSGREAAENARTAALAGNTRAAERYLLQAAEQINEALGAIGSTKRVQAIDRQSGRAVE